MAKTKTRKRGTGRGNLARSRSEYTTQATTAPLATAEANKRASSSTTRSLKRPASRFGSLVSSGLVTAGMVALGCLGMTIFFLFLYPDPNHVLFGCFAALMTLIWAYSFSVHLRKQMWHR